MFMFFETQAACTMTSRFILHRSFLSVNWLKAWRTGFILTHATGNMITCLVFPAIKWILFLLSQKTTSSCDKLCTTPDSVWWEPACETTWKTCCSSTKKLLAWICMTESITGHRHRVSPVHRASSAASRQLHSCIQLVADRGCDTELTDKNYAGLFCNNITFFFLNPLETYKCSLSLLGS